MDYQDSEKDVSDSASRRSIIKTAAGTVAAGALGSLAGCSGGSDDSGGESGATQTDDSDGTSEETQDTSTQSGGSESVTISFLSADAAENSKTREYYKKSMKEFESQQGNVKVDLQAVSASGLKNKLSSVVSAGNAPDLAQSGSLGLQFWKDGKTVDHGKYISETDGLPDKWADANVDSAKYRGDWWAAGSPRLTNTLLGIRPKFFKGVGVTDPSELETWTGFRRALDKIKEKYDTNAFEVTGTSGDLESYWGEARTAYTDGKDPWIRGDPENPEVLIGKNARTDGMIKNNVDLAQNYSSDSAATRGDEEIPSLMLTDRVASFTYALGNGPRWTAVKSDVEFGWDGDIYQQPIPKLDPNYGKEYGIEELAGKSGQHGGHTWSLEQQHQIFKSSSNPDAAWELLKYHNTSPDFLAELYANIYPASAAYEPVNDVIQDKYGDDLSQIHEASLKALNDYPKQYQSTGSTWDLENTSKIRWKAINETLSQAIAGEHKKSETPSIMRKRVKNAIKGK